MEAGVSPELSEQAQEGLEGVTRKANDYLNQGKITVDGVYVGPKAADNVEAGMETVAESAKEKLNSEKITVDNVGVSPDASNTLDYQLGAVVAGSNAHINNGSAPITIRKVDVDPAAGEGVNTEVSNIASAADALINRSIVLKSIGIDAGSLASKRQELVNTLRDFWQGEEGVWTKVEGFFQMPDSMKNGFNDMIDFINTLFGSNIKHLGEYDVGDVLGGIEDSESKANAIISYMAEIEKQYGEGAENTEAWMLAIQELEKYVPGVSTVLEQESGAVGSATEAIKAHTQAWYDDMKAQALFAAKEDYYNKLVDSAKNKATADMNLNIASHQMEQQRGAIEGLVDSAKALAGENNEAGAAAIESYLSDIFAEHGITDMATASTQDLYNAVSTLADTGEMVEHLGNLIHPFTDDFATTDKLAASDWAENAKSQLETYESAWQSYLDAQEAQKLAQTQYEDATKAYDEFSAAINAAMESATESAGTAEESIESLKASLDGTTDKDIYIRAHIIKPDGGFSAEDLLNLKHIDGSHASGLNYVPYDGYLAELHRGETVLNAADAEEHRSGPDGGSLAGLAAEVGNAVRSALEGVGIYMGAERVADLVTERVSQNIASEARERRYA